MNSDQNLVLYASVSKGSTILGDFRSTDPDLQTLASQCLEKTPPFHTMFSHTIRQRTYTFLVTDPDPIVYFSIFHEKIDSSNAVWFLNCLKDVFHDKVRTFLIDSSEIVSSYCLQSVFDPIFSALLVRVQESDSVSVVNNERSLSLNLSKGRKIVSLPVLGKRCEVWFKFQKKNKSGKFPGENNDGVDAKVNVIGNNADDAIENGEFVSVTLHKSGLDSADLWRQKANRTWRKHVWIVLAIDFLACLVLLATWLSICRGFQCIKE